MASACSSPACQLVLGWMRWNLSQPQRSSCSCLLPGDDGGVVVVPGVALGRYVHLEADVEVGLVLEHGLGIFGYLVVHVLRRVPATNNGTVVLAQGDALSAAHALRVVNLGFAVGVQVDGVVGTVLHANVAADAVRRVNLRLGGGVQFQFAGNSGGSHAQVLQCAAEACLFVSLEVGHADDDVRVGNGCTDFGCRTIFAVNGYFAVVGSFQSVGNDDLALGRDGVESVLHRTLQMVHGVGAAAVIEGVAVGQKRFGSVAAQQVGHACRIVGADVGQVARFAEVYLDGHKTVFQGQLGNAGLLHQTFHLVEQVGSG